jgi:hypothetical protein
MCNTKQRMEKTKIKIHKLTIKRSGEKQLFQIKLPKNAKKITGIQITTQPIITEQNANY